MLMYLLCSCAKMVCRFLEFLAHCGLLQRRHCEGLPGVAEGNSSSSARHDVSIHRLVTEDGNHRQRNS